MTVFKVGNSVEGIDDTVKGIVIAVNTNKITIESSEGFVLDFHPSELVRIPNSGSIRVTNYEIAQQKKEKELQPKKGHRTIKPKERNAPKMEVDLHINQLVKSSKSLTNFEILNLQMETAQRQLEFAIRKRIQKIVFIHGVGEGVLREELYSLFRRYENVKHYDADYQKYGLGATEVYVHQNN